MQTAESVQPRLYEELANHFAHQGESRQRDQCLVLAADAALTAGQPAEAERLRKRLLLTNPHHMLRPYFSFTEAMESNDVRAFVADLRKQWPPQTVAKMLNVPPPAVPTYALEPAPAAEAPPRPAEADPTRPQGSAGGSLLTLLFFMLALALALAAGFAALAD